MSDTPAGISACILARNEERRLEEALRSLEGWTEQIIVIDNESTDGTVELARRYTSDILSAPRALNFDAARNLAIERATGGWIFYLDADERVPPRLAETLKRLVEEEGDRFEAAEVPFRHHFCGRWMQNHAWWPGYTRPQLVKKGRFRYNERLHGGVQVDGRVIRLPADPELAIVHYSYDDVAHFIQKTNYYTDGEAENLLADGRDHSWQAQLAGFVHDWGLYYDHFRTGLDGMHGFILAFLYAFYRFLTRAKLWDLRRKRGELPVHDPVPESVAETLRFMLRVEREGAPAVLQEVAPSGPPCGNRVPARWYAGTEEPSPGGACHLDAEPEGPTATGGIERPADHVGITACIVARNEGGRIEAALRSLRGWVDQIIVVDNESDDDTAAVAGRYADLLLTAPPAANYEEARLSVAAEIDAVAFARGEWLFYLDADERVSPRLGAAVRKLAAERGGEFDALCLPFKHHFHGKWMQGGAWWPGYKGPQLLKRGTFRYDAAIHSGAVVDGRVFYFPADDPDLAVTHHAYDDLGHYLGKLNRYTDAEAELFHAADASHAWQAQLAYFVHDWRLHYDAGRAAADGMHGFIQSFLCSFYRFATLAKLWDLRRKRGELPAYEPVPASLAEMLQFMLEYAERLSPAAAPRALPATPREHDAGAVVPAAPRRPAANPVLLDPARPVDFRAVLGRPLRIRWEGPQSLRSSIALVNREFCLGLLGHDDVELSVVEEPTPWHQLPLGEDPRFAALFARRDAELSGPPDVTISHQYPPIWCRTSGGEEPEGKLVVMQPWEYGSLPREWVEGAAEGADEVWAYSRAVRDVYVRSGVAAEKVRVVPLGVRTEKFGPRGRRYPLPTEKGLRFLFVGGAIWRKGADLLLQAYRRAFTRDDDVCLVVKDMGMGTFYGGDSHGAAFRAAAADPEGPEVIYLEEDLPEGKLASLYRACSCVVLPYRGEGFGLSPLEGMASGLPAIVTAGGATDDYLDDLTALRVPASREKLRDPAPPECVEEPWILEPDLEALVDALRWVRDHPEETRERGTAAREQALGWSWERAVALARERLGELVAPLDGRTPASPVLWAEPAAPGDGVTSTIGAGAGAVEGGEQPPATGEPASDGRELPDAAGARTARGKRRGRKAGVAEGSEEEASATPPPDGSGADGGAASPPPPGPPAAPVRLSLCMIVRDEEARLADCLRSIAPYVDEMVVVDTGSRDRTREVARDCGARVFELPWPESFAAARNASLDQARGEWIFWMDADDVIPPECGTGLRELVGRCPERDAAYQMQVRIPPGPGEFSPSLVDHVKLFPNRPDLRFEHRIHEQILPAVRRAGLEVRFSELWVEHRNYDRSPEGQAKKRVRDFRLLELDLRDHPDHPFVLFNMGMTYLYATREYEVAAHYLRRSLDRSHPGDSIVRKAYALLTTARLCAGETEAALRANEEGRAHYPDDAELLFQAGQLYGQAGRLDEAEAVLVRLVTGADDPHYRSVDSALRSYRGRHELALLHRRRGDLAGSARLLEEIRAAHPAYVPAQIDLAETLAALGERAQAEAVLAAIPAEAGLAADVEQLRRWLGASAAEPPATEPPAAGPLPAEPLPSAAPGAGRGGRGRRRSEGEGSPAPAEAGTARAGELPKGE